jgi:excisionase family DNA binding protein
MYGVRHILCAKLWTPRHVQPEEHEMPTASTPPPRPPEATIEELLDPLRHPTVSIDEYARIFEIGRTTVYEQVAAGRIPCLSFGRRKRIPTAIVRRQLGLDEVQPAGTAA